MVCAGPLSCYAQWTIKTAIGNLGKEICQDCDPYANIVQCGVLRAQINLVQALYCDLPIGQRDPNWLPDRARDVGDGYALLPKYQDSVKPLTNFEYQALMVYWRNQGWPNQERWPNAVSQWARL